MTDGLFKLMPATMNVKRSAPKRGWGMHGPHLAPEGHPSMRFLHEQAREALIAEP